MDSDRAIEIFVPATGNVGSGYAIAPGLILTALHVVGNLRGRAVAPMQCSVRRLGPWNKADGQWLAQTARMGERPPAEQGWETAELCWPPISQPLPVHQPVSGYSRPIDLAVLRVVDNPTARPAMGAPRVLLGLGGFEDEFSCESIGFPQMTMRDIDGRRLRDLPPSEREQLVKRGGLVADSLSLKGTIRRDTALKDSQFHIQISGQTPSDPELWRGMSGAAVFDDDNRLIGVIAERTSEARHGCLIAEPIAIAKNDPVLADLLNIDGLLESLDRARRTFLSAAQGFARDVYRQSERGFERNLLAPFLNGKTILSPSKVFVRPEFRRKPGGSLLVPPEHSLTAPLDLLDVVSKQEAVLVIGEPGSGKSFAAADLARRMTEPWINGRPGSYFPLMLVAKDLATNDPGLELGDRLARAFRATANQGPSIPSDFLDRAQRAQTPVLIIIDGVDEIVGDANVASFLDWVNSTVRALPGRIKAVLFTRPLGLDPISHQIDQFAPFLLLPFNSERQQELVRRIYMHFDNDEVSSKAKADEFASRVDQLGISSLVDNPAVLTMLAISLSNFQAISRPETRGDVVAEYIKLLLSTFSRRYEDEFRRYVEQKLLGDPEFIRAHFLEVRHRDQNTILSVIGFLSTDSDAIDSPFFETAFAKCLAIGIFEKAEKFDANVYGDLLKQFVLRVGVLVESSNKLVFSHNLVREFLVALEWSRSGDMVAEVARATLAGNPSDGPSRVASPRRSRGSTNSATSGNCDLDI
jgi:hypothetical protein